MTDKNEMLVSHLPGEDIELEDKMSTKVKAEGMKSVLSSMKESDKAALLYSFNVTPTFFRNNVQKSQLERPTNKRKSTQYTWPTFFPIAFALQFKKLVNIFYILTGILNFFP